MADPGSQVKDVTESDRQMDRMPAAPRLRRSLDRSTPFVLTNQWQPIPFKSVNTNYDKNTFKKTTLNETTGAIMPNLDNPNDQLYRVEMDFNLSHTKRPLHVQLRYRVPVPPLNGVSQEVIFPMPETVQMEDVIEIETVYTGGLVGTLVGLIGTLNINNLSLGIDNLEKFSRFSSVPRTIYTAFGLKQYGVIPEMRIAEAYTGSDRPKLVDAVLFVYPG